MGTTTVGLGGGATHLAQGSNEKNLAQIWLEPQRDFAMVLVTNIGGSKANEALNALAPELYSRFTVPKTGRRRTRTSPLSWRDTMISHIDLESF